QIIIEGIIDVQSGQSPHILEEKLSAFYWMKGIITPKRLVRGTSFMRRKSDEKKRKGSPRWMVTYSDMVTLILVFFILLFSMSRIDQLKFESITESFQNRNVLDFISTDILSEEPSGNNGQNSGQADNG